MSAGVNVIISDGVRESIRAEQHCMRYPKILLFRRILVSTTTSENIDCHFALRGKRGSLIPITPSLQFEPTPPAKEARRAQKPN